MIKDWLDEKTSLTRYKYSVTEINEKSPVEKDLIKYLSLSLLEHFRDLNRLKRMFENRPLSELEDYIKNKIFPDISEDVEPGLRRLNMNVQQGDWGEVLTSLVISEIREVEVEFKKLRYKLNRSKSLFGIDVIAFKKNQQNDLQEALLFESKTRTSYKKNIGIEAYQSLCLNSKEAFIDIINFIATQHYEQHNYEMADKFDYLIIHPNAIEKSYHSFIIMEKNIWSEDILKTLNEEQFDFNNVFINVILIDNMNSLVKSTYENVIEVAKEIVYE